MQRSTAVQVREPEGDLNKNVPHALFWKGYCALPLDEPLQVASVAEFHDDVECAPVHERVVVPHHPRAVQRRHDVHLRNGVTLLTGTQLPDRNLLEHIHISVDLAVDLRERRQGCRQHHCR